MCASFTFAVFTLNFVILYQILCYRIDFVLSVFKILCVCLFPSFSIFSYKWRRAINLFLFSNLDFFMKNVPLKFFLRIWNTWNINSRVFILLLTIYLVRLKITYSLETSRLSSPLHCKIFIIKQIIRILYWVSQNLPQICSASA